MCIINTHNAVKIEDKNKTKNRQLFAIFLLIMNRLLRFLMMKALALSLTRVRKHRGLRRAVLNSGRGQTRPFAGHAEDSLHLIDCCAVSALPRRERRTEGQQRGKKTDEEVAG